jgi:hypothetical protein
MTFLADFFIVLFPFDFLSGDFPVIGIKTARNYSAILRYNVCIDKFGQNYGNAKLLTLGIIGHYLYLYHQKTTCYFTGLS